MEFAALLLLIASDSTVADLSYSPSWIVRAGHRMPHLNHLMQRQSNTWDITSTTINWNNKYIQSLIIPSIVSLIVGLTLFSSVKIFLSAQRRGLITTRPSAELLHQTPMSWARVVAFRKKILLLSFFSLVFIVFAAMSFSWYGFSRLQLAISDIGSLFFTLRNIENNG